MKKIIFIFSLIVISLTSCEKLCQPVEDPADKFVGKYSVVATIYDETEKDTWAEDPETVFITKVSSDCVHITLLNKDAYIAGNSITIRDFHTYEDKVYTEYTFEPGYYVNNLFNIKCNVVENDGYMKRCGHIDIVFYKID